VAKRSKANDAAKPRVVMSRVLRAGEKDDGRFDREFWQRAGTNAILDAMWQMVNDYRRLKGLPGDEPRLRRSVGRLIRRGR
jgi:hypothetical protein